MTLKRTLALIDWNLRERARLEKKSYGVRSYLKLLFNPPALVVVIFRFQHWLHVRGNTGCAEMLRRLNLMAFTTEIGSEAIIGENLFLYHQNLVCITGRCRIGKNVHFVHHNSVTTRLSAGSPSKQRVRIGDNVVFGAGARVIGPVEIGHDSFIAANAVVDRDLPPYSFYFGEEAVEQSSEKVRRAIRHED